LEKVLNFFTINLAPNFLSCLNLLFIDDDNAIPCYINDKPLMIHLAFIHYPQIGDRSLEKVVLDYLSDDEEEDVDSDESI
jgi:hypothetical protein